MHRKCVSMKKEAVEKIAQEIAQLNNLSEDKANAIVNKVIKLIKQNGYGIVSTRNYNYKE